MIAHEQRRAPRREVELLSPLRRGEPVPEPVEVRPAWSDPVGADVGERLRPVRVRVIFEYHVESQRVRRRGDRIYPREDVKVERPFLFSFSSEVLDASDGASLMVKSLATRLYKRLVYEGWPIKVREAEG